MPVITAFLFLTLNVGIISAVYRKSKEKQELDNRIDGDNDLMPKYGTFQIDPHHVLAWEFEYARITASEAMRDRHTMINFYIILAGAFSSGVIASQVTDIDLPLYVGTILLWALCCIGWFNFLMLVRLRQAWHDSAKTMNRIKDFCVANAMQPENRALGDAFRWSTKTLPQPEQNWTVFSYSAFLIAFLNSVAYVAGALLWVKHAGMMEYGSVLIVVVFGLTLFWFHVKMYFDFLKEPEPSGSGERPSGHQAGPGGAR